MNHGSLWKKAIDGVTYLAPEGLIYQYYIYPSYYSTDSHSNKYELWLLKEDGEYDHRKIYQFDTLEEAQEFAVIKIRETLKSLMDIFYPNNK